MRIPKPFLLLLAAFALAARLHATAILLLSTGSTALDEQTKGVLEASGHTVTLGSAYTSFNASELLNIDVVLLFPSVNWPAGDIPVAGQSALIDFVYAGGGLVTAEWTNWKAAGAFTTLGSILPVVATSNYSGGSTITYSQATPDAVLGAGLPEAFTFTADNIGGTESFFEAKSGATTFYTSTGSANGAGVIGWDVGSGRVLQISTVAGPLELANSNYATLLSNSVTWVAVPEPSTYALFAIGVGSLGLHVWRRRLKTQRTAHAPHGSSERARR